MKNIDPDQRRIVEQRMQHSVRLQEVSQYSIENVLRKQRVEATVSTTVGDGISVRMWRLTVQNFVEGHLR